eukprot:6753640-Ditylum_brightwellii.AAC.1
MHRTITPLLKRKENSSGLFPPELNRTMAVFKHTTFEYIIPFYLILPLVFEKLTTTMAIIWAHHGTSASALIAHSLASHRSLKNYGATQQKQQLKEHTTLTGIS